MAIQLQVNLTDSEQAKVLEIAAVDAPGATGPQIKAWAEKLMKNALRDEIVGRDRAIRREAENDARKVAEAALEVDWAAPVEDEPET